MNQTKEQLETMGFINEVLETMGITGDIVSETVTRNNITYDGLIVKSTSISVSPIIKVGMSKWEIEEAFKNAPIVRGKVPANYDELKPMLSAKLINYENNKDYLAGKVYDRFLDLAIVYMGIIDDEGAFAIPESMIKNFGISKEVLVKDVKFSPITFKFLDMLTVITTENKVFGAIVMTDIDFLKGLYQKVGEFYILPSSIHKCLIVPKASENADVEALKEMVREVNDNEVSPDERLSYNVYFFNGSEVIIAEK